MIWPMTHARSILIPPGSPGTFHCVSRCVRRAFLCGEDRLTGRSFEHRRQWVEDRIHELAGIFGVAIWGYAVMSNHVHVVVQTLPEAVAGWSADEVAARWLRLFPRQDQNAEMRAEVLAGNDERIAVLRERLSDLSWFMRCLAGMAVLISAKVLPAVLGNLQNPYLAAIGKQLASGALNPLFWVLAGLCWLAALLSFLGQKRRQKLLEAQSSLDTLRAMSWRELEQLVSEAYRRNGYQVQETGQGGADGGIDLVLRRDGQVTLVQCKHWRTQRVGAPVVREQFGLLTHHQAAAVVIVTTGDFTPEAKAFAEGKPIELMAGQELLALVQSVQRPSSTRVTAVDATATLPTASEPTCPTCSAPMVRRTAKQTKAVFLGCSRFPACRGTRPI